MIVETRLPLSTSVLMGIGVSGVATDIVKLIAFNNMISYLCRSVRLPGLVAQDTISVFPTISSVFRSVLCFLLDEFD